MPFCGKRAVYLPLLFTIDPTGKRACASCVTIIVSRYFLFYPLFLLFRLLRFKYFSRPPPLIVRRATVPLLFQSDTFPSFVITIKTVPSFFISIFQCNSSSSFFLLYLDFFNCLEDSFEKKRTEIERKREISSSFFSPFLFWFFYFNLIIRKIRSIQGNSWNWKRELLSMIGLSSCNFKNL